MNTKLALAYHQLRISDPVLVSNRIEAVVLNLRDFRPSHSLVEAEHVLAAILGKQQQPLSAILGVHPDHPKDVHPVHGCILKSLISRTSADINPNFKPLLVETLDSNAVVIGGPRSSAHARALFGTANHPSILPVKLPVHFKMLDSSTSLIIKGKETREEYFLLTSLPMADHRLINISSLRQAGGKAADMIFGNEQIIDDLLICTRPMQSGGWQALFRVHTLRSRVKQMYKLQADRFKIEWSGRRYDRANPLAADLPNQALNHAASAVEAAAAIAVAATATIPQLGFIHEDSGQSFVLDIADLFRDEFTVPVAFGAAAHVDKNPTENIERTVSGPATPPGLGLRPAFLRRPRASGRRFSTLATG